MESLGKSDRYASSAGAAGGQPAQKLTGVLTDRTLSPALHIRAMWE
jgi:hypothetical protein